MIKKNISGDITETTKKSYKVSLNKLETFGIDIDNVNINDIKHVIANNNVPIMSMLSYMIALLWHCRKNDADDTVILFLETTIKAMNKVIKDMYNENKLTDKEYKNFISWNTVLKVHEKLKEVMLLDDNIEVVEDYLILSFYIYHPPRRLDYYNMYVQNVEIPTDVNKILWTNDRNAKKYNTVYSKDDIARIIDYKNDDMDHKNEIKELMRNEDKKNYYVKKGSRYFFVFEDYKTNNIYGKQVIEVHKELNKIIRYMISLKKIKKGDKLINLTHDNFKDRLKSIFYKTTKKNISASMLRHIYITHVLSDKNISTNDKIILSNKMAHSLLTQSIYKKITPMTIDDNTVIYDYTKNKKYDNDEERKNAKKETQKKYYKNKKAKNI